MLRLLTNTLLLSFFCLLSGTVDANSLSFTDKIKQHYQAAKNLKRIYYKVTFTSTAPTQSYDFRSPTDIVNHYAIELDLDRKQFFQHFKRQNPGNFVFENISVIDNEMSFRYDVNGFVFGKTLQPYNSTISDEFDAMSEHISTLAVANLLYREENVLTELIIEDKVSISYTDKKNNKFTYIFDRHSLQLLSLTDESDQSTLVFSKPLPVNGLTYASKVETFIEGKLSNVINIPVFHPITRIDAKKLQPPAGYAFEQSTTAPTPQLQKLSEQIYLIENIASNRNVLLYQHTNGVTVFGAPRSDKISEQVIDIIKKTLPNNNITHVYVSHAHGDHIAGLKAYTQIGATVIADEYTIKAIKHFERFEDTLADFSFKEIKHNEIFQQVAYFVLENSHVRKQSFVLFPQEQLIYQGDFLEIPKDNSIASHMSDVEKTFIEYLADNKIAYQRIVGHHRNSNIKPNIVEAYYQYNTQ